MHISKVELENIKSHVDSKFEFSRGTTAITGRNGAGKTTILEGIAWALFDVLDYKKEDFVRRGEKKGSVTITFESGLDEREYIVYRDTATGYSVHDPRLGARVADKREEVIRFLWQHLGLEPGTDLRTLFKEAVGVPQGTLTAIFSGTPVERKSTFDRLLKVEEYRQAAEKLRETSRFIDNSIAAVNVRIARAEGELVRFNITDEEYRSTAADASRLADELNALSSEVEKRAAVVSRLDEQEKRTAELRSAVERAKIELDHAQFICRRWETEFRQASEAATRVAEVRDRAMRHSELLGRLRELERERNERDCLRQEQSKIETALANVQSEHKHLDQALNDALSAHASIEPLRPKAIEQEALERSIDELKAKITATRAVEKQVKSLDDRLVRLRDNYKTNLARIREAEIRTNEAVRVSELELRNSDLLGRLAKLSASLERDEKFQSEIRNGLCPILSEKCLNLKDGQTLDGFIADQFAELKNEIAALEKEKDSVSRSLETARAAHQLSATLDTLRVHQTEMVGEGKVLSDERRELEKQLIDVSSLEEQLKIGETELKALDDPRARIKLYQEAAAREPELRRQLSKIESNLERLESDRKILLMRLESYKDLDILIAEASSERDATAEANRIFLANEMLASCVTEKEKLFEAARIAASGLGDMLAAAERESAAANDTYNAEQHAAERATLRDVEQRSSETGATLDAVSKRRDQLKAELDRFTELRRSLKTEFSESERLAKVSEITAFIRETLREAAPRVARNYVHHVSLEACQMYREICGQAEQTLSWSEDYGILIEQDGYERPFGNLSGGERTAAALSIRLAILKQLSDIRMAFFDEPTTNMDAERRENLAQQISQIKNFDQLFVISHDDTFEGYVDNVISLQ